MSIIFFRTAFGVVKMLCIGEWSVQSVVLHVSVGDSVLKLDEVAHFHFGSQVLLIMPSAVSVVVGPKERVFPGDAIANWTPPSSSTDADAHRDKGGSALLATTSAHVPAP